MRPLGPGRREIAEAVQTIDVQRLRQHVVQIANLGPRGLYDRRAREAAREYIQQQLCAVGYDPIVQEYDARRGQANVTVEQPGMQWPDRVLELGAHYDTVPGSPGADDNASGIAGVLEVARLLAQFSPIRTVRLCFFDGEESGLTGSRAHVARLDRERRHLEGIVVFEMIGYRSPSPDSQRTPVRIPLVLWPPRTGNFLLVLANYRSRQLAARFQRAARRYVPELSLYCIKRLGGWFQDAARSDHWPYWQARRAGLMLTDTANFRNPHYHQPSDLPETLDYDFLAAITRATAAMLLA